MNGKQHHFCPNCGKPLYDNLLSMRAQPMMCSESCRKQWELKYTNMMLGKSDEEW